MNVKLIDAMIAYDAGDPKRSQHFIKVWAYAKAIGLGEGLDARTLHILETAALVHDIGIRESERIHGAGICDGKKQEKYGPPIAEKLLRELGEEEDTIARVAFLVGVHHTYEGVDALDWQILLEADYIVNAYEDEKSTAGIENAYDRLFKTRTGKRILREMFGLNRPASPDTGLQRS